MGGNEHSLFCWVGLRKVVYDHNQLFINYLHLSITLLHKQ